MKVIIFFVLGILLCSCGGGGNSQNDAKRNVDRQDINKNIDDLPYPGFYEVDSEGKSNLKKDNSNYRDGYFDRHETTLRKDQTFYMDVVTREVLQDFAAFDESSSSSETAYSYSVDIHRGINVEADYGTSDLFLLSGTTNYLEVIVSWDVDERPEELKEHKFYICDPDDKKNLFDESYILSEEDWDAPKGNASMSKIIPVDKPGKYGLCRQYKDYDPVIYDVVNVILYNGAEYDVSIINVGEEGSLSTNFIKNSKDYFYRAGVDINYTIHPYDTPKDFQVEEIKGSKFINYREKYLFVRGRFIDENSSGKECYKYISDDITNINERIRFDVYNNDVQKRLAVVYNKKHVKFWTFYKTPEGYVLPCYDGIEQEGRPSPDVDYKVAILNTDLNDCEYWNNQMDVDYTRLYVKYISEEKKWIASDGFNVYGSSDFSDLFNPQCHVFVDMSYDGKWHRENKPNESYLKSVIPESSKGITKEIESPYNKSIIGLWAFIDPLNGVRTYMHELGHLLGLSDVKSDNNLMHWNSPEPEKNKNMDLVKIMLNNRSLEATKCADCIWEKNKEMQWDCLNGVNVSSTCYQENHRTLNWSK